MEISRHTHMLEINGHNVCLYPVLTWDDDHIILIDAGFPGQTDVFVRAIEDAGQRVEALTDIILTHQDADHIGCVHDLLKLAPNARVIAHTEEAPYIDGTLPPIKGFHSQNIRVDQTVTDGEILPMCGGIEVVHTPGHTPGHICLLLHEGNVIVCGDALNISNGKIIGPNPQYTQDMATGLLSLEKIKSFHPAAVVSYHCDYLKCDG